MRFHIDYQCGKAVYVQIMEQVRAGAASGLFGDGDPLPSVRQLAEQLRINRNTIAKAYSELEHEGVVAGEPGRGYFVRISESPLRKSVRDEMLAQDLDSVIVRAHQLQVSDDQLRKLLDQRIEAFNRRRDANTDSFSK